MRILVAILFLTYAQPAFSQQIAEVAAPPDAGVTDAYLATLGPMAETDLLDRLDDPKKAKYAEGLIFRLRLHGDVKKPNKRIVDRLKKYVERQAKLDGAVSKNQIFAIGSALEAIGQRGGDEGTEYLHKWVMDDVFLAAIKIYYPGGSADWTRDLMRQSAVLGLGLSGSNKSYQMLLEIQKNPPVVSYKGNFMGVLDRAISENRKINKDGIEKMLDPDIKRLKARSKRK